MEKATIVGIIDIPSRFEYEDICTIFENVNIWSGVEIMVCDDDAKLAEVERMAEEYDLVLNVISSKEADARTYVVNNCDYLICGPVDDNGRDDLLATVEERGIYCTLLEEEF